MVIKMLLSIVYHICCYISLPPCMFVHSVVCHYHNRDGGGNNKQPYTQKGEKEGSNKRK